MPQKITRTTHTAKIAKRSARSGPAAQQKKGTRALVRTLAKHKKAYFNYHIVAEEEAGIVLVGSEIKSVRTGAVNLSGSYARITPENEVVILNVHIKHYNAASYTNHEPTRTRKLLLKKKQIRKWQAKLKITGHTLIPLEMYLKGNWVKIKLGLCMGKKLYDKRVVLKERAVKKRVEGYMKTRYLRE